MSLDSWYGLWCWNGLSHEQQRKLIERGSLNAFDPHDSVPQGGCKNLATVAIETVHDEAPGPRFYCMNCAIGHLIEQLVASLG